MQIQFTIVEKKRVMRKDCRLRVEKSQGRMLIFCEKRIEGYKRDVSGNDDI